MFEFKKDISFRSKLQDVFLKHLAMLPFGSHRQSQLHKTFIANGLESELNKI